jgi:hypothetical protein
MPFSPMLRQSLIGRLDSADCVLGKLNAFDTSHAAALQSFLKQLHPSRFGFARLVYPCHFMLPGIRKGFCMMSQYIMRSLTTWCIQWCAPTRNASSSAPARLTFIVTSIREPSRLMIVMRRSAVKRPKSARRMREKSAAAMPVRRCAFRTLNLSRSRVLMISAAKSALNCSISAFFFADHGTHFHSPE